MQASPPNLLGGYLFLFLSLLLGLLPPLHAQTYIPEHRLYGIKDGLSHRQVNDVLEDRQGFIWVATPLGLNRFDGSSFQVWGREDGLHTDQILHLFEDAAGLIWVFHMQASEGIDLIDPRTNQILSFAKHYGAKLPVDTKAMSGYPFLAKDSTLYWAKPHGFVTFHPRRGFRSVTIKSIQNDSSATFALDFASAQKTVWGIITKPGHNALVEVNSNGDILQRIDNQYRELFFTRPGRFSDGMVHHYTLTQKNYTNVCLRISETNKISRASSPRLWPSFDYPYFLNTYAELLGGELLFSDYRVFDKTKLLFDFNGDYPQVGGTARSFLLDRNHNIWLGTDHGLMLLTIRKNQFRRFLFTGDASKPKIACRGILEHDGQLLVSTEGGVFVGDKTTGVFEPFPGTTRAKNDLVAPYWYGLTNDQTGAVFVGHEQLLHRLTMKPVRSVTRLADKLYVPWTMVPDNQQRLWIGTYRDGLALYDGRTGQLNSYSQYNGFNELRTAGIVSIQPDRRGGFWLCATTGLYRLDLQKGVTERHWSGGKGTFYLPYDNIYHLHEDAEGVFWLATGGGGLISWIRNDGDAANRPRKTGQTRQFSQKSGLPNNTLYAVYEDSHHHLWLPSDYGIIQFDKTRGVVRRIYLPEDGTTHTEFNRTSHYRAPDSTLYFGSLNGITVFNPADFYGGTEAGQAPMVVTGFQQFDGNSNQLVDKTTNLLTHNEIVMQPDDRFFNLEFALLTFNQSDKSQYAYKIDGVDANWTYQTEPRLRLTRLPYGTHTLHIKGQAANGLWGSNELTIRVRAIPPVYLRTWFLVGSVAALLLLVWLLFRWRTGDLQKNQRRLETEVSRQTAQIQGQAEKLRQLDELKTRLYTNITHEFRTPLTVIMGMTTEIEETVSGTDYRHSSLIVRATNLIQRNSKNLLRLINQLLDLAKLDSGSMNVHLVQADLVNYLRYLTESFYSLAQDKKIELVFQTETPALVMDFDEDKIQLIVYNLLSNAIKFTGEGGSITLSVAKKQAKSGPTALLTVRDTGVGIAETDLPHIFDRFYQANHVNARSGEGTGIGLALTKELVELLDGQISATSSPDEGTIFRLQLPIKRTILTDKPETKPLDFQPRATDIPSTLRPQTTDATLQSTDPDKPLLLLIEDNADVTLYIQNLLQPTYQIETAPNGNVGIERAFEQIPDIVISDVMMPEKDGYEVCHTLKTDERTSHIPIILLTAKATQTDKLTGLRLGADAYLTKPFQKDELLVLLEQQIALRRMLQKRYGLPTLQVDEQPVQVIAPARLSGLDEAFLQKIRQVIEAKIDDSELGVSHLSEAVSLSQTQVFRKLKALTGENPTLYIRKLRLQHALHLLTITELPVTQVAYAVGFSDPNYFSRTFHEEFGKAPSGVRK